MKLLITPSRPRKSICAPPSKSFAHRALICAALSGRECTVKLTSVSQDIEATLRRDLGDRRKGRSRGRRNTNHPDRKRTRKHGHRLR